MTHTIFSWAWEHYGAQPDALMTRQRAARLLRAWRRARIQGRRVFALGRSTTARTRIYAIEHVPTGERATLIIEEAPGESK